MGPATFVDPADGSRKSAYLDEERVVAALLAADVDAVWVGWGFVAERASFAQRCEDAGIVFVGPDSATIRMLGDKVAAKRLAEKVGVPVVPWSGDVVQTVAEASAHAVRLGYPVMLKAAARRWRTRHQACPGAGGPVVVQRQPRCNWICTTAWRGAVLGEPGVRFWPGESGVLHRTRRGAHRDLRRYRDLGRSGAGRTSHRLRGPRLHLRMRSHGVAGHWRAACSR